MKGFCAEKEGFEPPVPRGTLVFKTSAFDHSATSLGRLYCHSVEWECKSRRIFYLVKC